MRVEKQPYIDDDNNNDNNNNNNNNNNNKVKKVRKLRKVLKSKLNGGNLIRGVNTWAVFLLRYSAVFVS